MPPTAPPTDPTPEVAPSAAAHVPVLLEAVLELLAPAPGESLIDATFGEGGHARALLARTAPDGPVLGLDADPEAIARHADWTASQGARVTLRHARFGRLARLVRSTEVPGVFAAGADLLLADLGMNSRQLDLPGRGFSFREEGPLDLRFDPTAGASARELIATTTEQALADLIFELGEERHSRRVARALKGAVSRGGCQTTTEAARAIVAALPKTARHGRRHAATRTFQALRIAVNDELEELGRLLRALPALLAPGGRAGVISFHSLEDRAVKRAFRRLAAEQGFTIRTARPITASAAETRANPRARSAKLRVIARAPGACSE